MIRTRLTVIALFLPAVLLALGSTLAEVTVCITEDDHAPRPAHSIPRPDCEHPDSEPAAGEMVEHWDCRSGSCRYVSVRVHATPVTSGKHRASAGDLPGDTAAPGVIAPPPVEQRQSTPILHSPAPQLRALLLSTAMRF